MIDLLIISAFFITRFFPQATIFLSQFFDDIQSNIILNVIFLLIIAIFLLIQKKKNPHIIRQYFTGIAPPKFYDILIGIIAGIILISIGILFNPVNSFHPPSFLLSSPIISIILFIILATCVEEFFYRSYIIARLQHAKISKIFVILYSSLFFSLGHMSAGFVGVAFSGIAGILLALLVIFKRSVWAPIISHITYNMYVWSILQFHQV